MSEEHHCDVCIIGAGIAGLNALFAATRHLPDRSRVALVDRRPRAGGMWVSTYPYVRLHQPHPFFTAGNLPWNIDRPRGHLATRDEVLDHLQHCVDELGQRLDVSKHFECEYRSHEETADGVEIVCEDALGAPVVFRAEKLIRAFGYDIVGNDPLPVASKRVRSISPDTEDLRNGEMRTSAAPVYVVGGGKTAMDTAHTLLREYPQRKIYLIAGSGTAFATRDTLFPEGVRRWFGGRLISETFIDLARRFDGTNEEDVHAYFSDNHCSSPVEQPERFRFALLSRGECESIRAGVEEVISDHFEDVVDNGEGAEIVLRSGRRRPAPDGAWFVNCTGYLCRREVPYTPFASPSGNVLTINVRSAIHFLTSVSSYFLSHLMFAGQLRDLPLYELDLYELERRAKRAYPYAAATLSVYNLCVISTAAPMSVMNECGVDLDRWYPLHQRLVGLARLLHNRRRHLDHFRRTLDAVGERFDIRCGPLA